MPQTRSKAKAAMTMRKVKTADIAAGDGTDAARTYKSEPLAAIHETMLGLREAGGISDKTMRQFDAACLTEVQAFSADAIRALRQREGVSQAVFAHYLNVTPGLVSQWERGEKAPGSPALKLLSLVERKGIDHIA